MDNEAQAIEESMQGLMAACKRRGGLSEKEENDILRAFTIARNAHQGTRRKSGEPYIFHPLAVARIAVTEIGLGPIAVICALLHDVVEDTDITLDQLRATFGDRVAKIVDGVTKITAVTRLTEQQTEGLDTDTLEGAAEHSSLQAENYRKILLAMCDDVYVIFLKLCDRLHNMRTLDSMLETKRLAIASETQYLYIPLAHRLGLYKIKTELEDLVMKHTNPSQYAEIEQKITQAAELMPRLEERFFTPIRHALDAEGYHYAIKTRVKSVFSCFKKMQNKGVDFNEIYDLFAMRIILSVPEEREKEECFRVYATVSKLFRPNPSRFRDWITTPKNNGYESVHTTVMSPVGRWVEVQIRSQRMDEIAEKGMAAHFLYKEAHPEEHIDGNPVEEWLQDLRTTLENSSKSSLDLVEEFKETLTMRNIFVFTPKGEMVELPAHATVLDFAYAIHSHLGSTCMGAKVNSQVVPVQYVLHSGDQVQIISSKTAQPTEQWLSIAITTKAKDYIKDQLRQQKRQHEEEGKSKLAKILANLHRANDASTIGQCMRYFNLRSKLDLYYKVDTGELDELDFRQAFGMAKKTPNLIFLKPYKEVFGDDQQPTGSAPQGDTSDPKQPTHGAPEAGQSTSVPFMLEQKYENISAHPATCCKPVQGDDVVGILEHGEIEVHRSNCPVAMHHMSIHKDRIVRARWRQGEKVTFLTGIAITGIDRKGLLQEMTGIISNEMNLNMRAITIEASEGVARGIVMLYVNDRSRCDNLIRRLREIEGIEVVKRI